MTMTDSTYSKWRLSQLSPTQKNILYKLAIGVTRPNVCTELSISPSTLSHHLAKARLLLEAETTVQAVAIAVDQELIFLRQKKTPPVAPVHTQDNIQELDVMYKSEFIEFLKNALDFGPWRYASPQQREFLKHMGNLETHTKVEKTEIVNATGWKPNTVKTYRRKIKLPLGIKSRDSEQAKVSAEKLTLIARIYHALNRLQKIDLPKTNPPTLD